MSAVRAYDPFVSQMVSRQAGVYEMIHSIGDLRGRADRFSLVRPVTCLISIIFECFQYIFEVFSTGGPRSARPEYIVLSFPSVFNGVDVPDVQIENIELHSSPVWSPDAAAAGFSRTLTESFSRHSRVGLRFRHTLNSFYFYSETLAVRSNCYYIFNRMRNVHGFRMKREYMYIYIFIF